MRERTIMRKRDLRSIERGFNRVLRNERFKAGVITTATIWARGLLVIVEMIAILFGMYYFSQWVSNMTQKNQMRVVWTIVIGFLVVLLPLILGAVAGVVSKASAYVKEVIK